MTTSDDVDAAPLEEDRPEPVDMPEAAHDEDGHLWVRAPESPGGPLIWFCLTAPRPGRTTRGVHWTCATTAY